MRYYAESVMIIVLLIATFITDYFIDELLLSLIYIVLVIYTFYVYTKQHDNNIIIKKLHSNRRFKDDKLKDYYVMFIELTNLNNYSQFYDSNIGDQIFKSVLKEIKTYIFRRNLYIYRNDQIVIIQEFKNKHVLNVALREEEMINGANKVSSLINQTAHKLGYKITQHIGTAALGMLKDEQSMNELIRLAEFTMIKAKSLEKTILPATEQFRSIKQDLDSFNLEIENGLKLDEFVPYFFPIIDPHTMQITGTESLVRWTKDKYREIEASKFKDIAKEKNLFERIDKRVIHKTFKAYKTWKELKLINDTFTITINLSYQSLVTLNIQNLLNMAKEHNIDPLNVSFDISEESIKSKTGLAHVRKLREAGFRISLDALLNKSFSLDTLLMIDFDSLKINQTISLNSNQSNKQLLLHKSLVEFSNNTNTKILSKGVEDKQQLTYALQLNVDYVQGYYFTKPLNDEQIIVYLNKYKDGIQTH